MFDWSNAPRVCVVILRQREGASRPGHSTVFLGLEMAYAYAMTRRRKKEGAILWGMRDALREAG